MLLMTGLSGFVGSALAAIFLSRFPSLEIISLSNDDPDGTRVQTSVNEAALGFGLPTVDSLRIRPVFLPNLISDTRSLTLLDIYPIEEVWHIGAEMSYKMEDFTRVVQANTVFSGSLFRHFGDKVKQFVFFSTIGVVGPGDDGEPCEISETLPPTFEALNPYTVSKGYAEHHLMHSSRNLSSSLSIVRPAAILGHSKTGWGPKNRYGYYSYIHFIRSSANKNQTVYLEVTPESTYPFIFIDDLAQFSCALLQTPPEKKQEGMIFHVLNQNLPTIGHHFELVQHLLGKPGMVHYGRGQRGFQQRFNDINRDNNRFLSTRLRFSMDTYRTILKNAYQPTMVTDGRLTAMLKGFLK